jgi:hypothetical protein
MVTSMALFARHLIPVAVVAAALVATAGVFTFARPGYQPAHAILAAPTVGVTPEKTCLAAVLQGDAPVVWQCPGARPTRGDLANAHVLVAAAAFTWRTPGRKPQYPLYLAGVARGDVYRVVLHARGIIPRTLYTRGTTWGEFSSASGLSQGGAFLAIYGRHGLVQKLPVDVAPGQQRVIQ